MTRGPLLTLIIGSIISVIVFLQVQSWEALKTQQFFEFSSQLRLASLQADIVRHEEMVSSISGLFSSSKNVSRKEFRDFVDSALKRYPYIHGFSWNPLITNSERERYVTKARNEGFDDFDITELNSERQLARAPVRDNYIAVYYIEPFLRNNNALGFNIASHPGRLMAIEQARDTGLAVMTERIKLVQEKEENFGYLLFKAIYKKGSVLDTITKRRENFMGLAVGVFRFKDWIPLTMRNIDPLGIDVWITDETGIDGDQLLHLHSSRTRTEPLKPENFDPTTAKMGLHWHISLDIMGRRWGFLFAPSPEFISKHQTWYARISLLVGLLITTMLSYYLFMKGRHTQKLAVTNNELQNALQEIKTLKGIIPICSYCHRIRDDEGAWDQLESYLTKHSDASFSHGICPKCMAKIKM